MEEETVYRFFQMEAREFGKDMASRRLRSCFRTALRMRFGHAIIVKVLVTVGWWSKTFAARLACEQLRRTGESLLPAYTPGTNRTAGGRKKISRRQKAKKRVRYYGNVSNACDADPCREATLGCSKLQTYIHARADFHSNS